MESAFLQITRPVLFELAESEWTYGGKGSSFLVSLKNDYFFVSAKHVFDNQGGTPESLRVFPSDNSRISIPFDALAVIHLDGTGDESYKDLYLLKIATEAARASGNTRLFAFALDTGCARMESISEGDKILLIGFPTEIRGVDFERCRISYARKLLEAV